MAPEQNWLLTLGLVTSSVVAVTANSLPLLVFFRRRGLRTVSNRFVINLLVTNLLSSVFLVPLLIVDQESGGGDVLEKFVNISVTNGTGGGSKVFFSEEIVRGRDVVESDEVIIDRHNLEILKIDYKDGGGAKFSRFLCCFAQSVTNLICTTSILSILLIGIDQYFAVIHPLRYHSYIDKCKSTMLLVGCWLFSVTFAVLGTSVSADSNFWKFCKRDSEPSILTTAYSFSYFALVIFVPFVTICVIYVCIYTAARKNSKRMRKSKSPSSADNLNTYAHFPIRIDAPTPIPKVQSAPNFIDLEVLAASPKVTRSSSDRSSKNLIDSLKSRISNASIFKYREETRAAKISILVIFMVLICYSPYGVAVLLQVSSNLSLILLVVSNIVSPFLFAYRNRRIQRELFKLLRLVPPKPTARKLDAAAVEPFLVVDAPSPPKVDSDECKIENEKKSILKRVCSSKNWSGYKKCNFITVPDSCLDARGSFSSASTQISTEE